MNWRKSKHSNPNGACIEVADGVRVRDTADRSGPELRFTPEAWAGFTAALKGDK